MSPDGAAERARLARAANAGEHRRAAELLGGFVAEAVRRGIPAVPLTARSWSGRGGYRTDRTGWYLKRDHSVAVDVDGEFLVLAVSVRVGDRWRRLRIEPSDPPLVVGRGGRDGQAVDLRELIRLRLDAGPDF